MTRDDIIRIATEAGFEIEDSFLSLDACVDGRAITERLERFAALVAAAEREKVAAWMLARSYATGHGDTVEDLLNELEWQVAEIEREACAKLAGPHLAGRIAAAIRARGKT